MSAPPPVPALPDTERRTSYAIAAQTGPFAVNFAVYGDGTDYANWVEVWLNDSQLASNAFTLTSPSGPISSISRPITDAVITLVTASSGSLQIVGARRPRRTSGFSENGGVSARDLNQLLNDAIAQNRETWDRMRSRMLSVPPGETISQLPPATQRGGQVFGFDAFGNPQMILLTTNPPTTAGREQLINDRVYFVRPDGNDSNSGLTNTAGGAFLTIQKAVDTAYLKIDPQGKNVGINVADGTYAAGASLSNYQTGMEVQLSITGNVGAPANVLISAVGDCFPITGLARVELSGMKLVSSAGDGINASAFAKVGYASMDFGACAGSHITIDGFAQVLCTGDYSITGVAGAHIHMPEPGFFASGAHTCTIVGTLTGAAFFIGARASGAYAFLANMTFVNGAGWNAGRYVSHFGAVIDCEGKSKDFLPGTSPGVSNDGGQYIGLTAVVGLGNLLNQIAVDASVTLDFRRGLVWFDDANTASALVSYAGSTGTPIPTIVWQSVNNAFVTGADPGSGSNKWWLRSGGIATNRFGALASLNYAIVTPEG